VQILITAGFGAFGGGTIIRAAEAGAAANKIPKQRKQKVKALKALGKKLELRRCI
jgi:hypothetical protein